MTTGDQSAIAAGVELPALLQLIHECCQAIQGVQFIMPTSRTKERASGYTQYEVVTYWR
ncbi:hypothetical protein [Phaeodactylibacter xiamenensis]|uniref:hypothetical protein n=1 Tax=Phaeodactylibacter xiamenensis TaxID=1524460 RepID=UPI003CCC298D